MKNILLAGMPLLGMGLSLSAGDLEKYTKACDGGDMNGCRKYVELNKNNINIEFHF